AAHLRLPRPAGQVPADHGRAAPAQPHRRDLRLPPGHRRRGVAMTEADRSKELLERVEKSGAAKIKVAVTDIDGVLRGQYMHKDKFRSVVESGFGFCDVVFGWDSSDVCYDNVRFTGWHTGYPDALVRVDPGTYREVPWDGGVPFLLGDFVDKEGGPLGICPRQ